MLKGLDKNEWRKIGVLNHPYIVITKHPYQGALDGWFADA